MRIRVRQVIHREQSEPEGHRLDSQRDYTKYLFDGHALGKARLVLALVNRYVGDHAQTTFSSLRQAFPDSLQALSPIQFSSTQIVVAKVHDLTVSEMRRFFVGPGETIQLLDGEVAVSREWNRFNIKNVLQHVRQFGYEPVPIRDPSA